MKVLLLGGTGAMGSYLGQILSDKGIDTYITTRRQRTNKKHISYIVGNAHESSFLDKILSERWDVIVDFMVYTTIEFKERANKLLDATEHYFYLSSSRVYADAKGLITENSPRLLDVSDDKEYLQTDEYALTKARQENILHQSSSKNWTIIRPYITYGTERLQLGVLEKDDWLYRALNGLTIAFSKDIAERTTTLTSGYDVARAMVELMGKETAKGEAFHITTNQSIQWSRVLEIYSDILERQLGKRPKTKLLNLERFVKVQGGKYQINYDRLYNRTFDNRKIAQYIDITTFKTPEEGLTEALKQFLNNPIFKPASKVSMSRKNIEVEESSIADFVIIGLGFIKQIIRRIIK